MCLLHACTRIRYETAVAPRAGAGIETNMLRELETISTVAPRAGAGIETFPLLLLLCLFRAVAPRAGAGIETEASARGVKGGMSRLVRARGLKRR